MILQKRWLDFKVCVIYFIMSYFVINGVIYPSINFIMSYFIINGVIYPSITHDTKLINLR
jgi:hypothetical protein